MSPKRTNVYGLFAFVCGVFLLSAPARGANTPREMSNECVGPEAKKTLSECPGGPAKFEPKKKIDAAFHSAPPPREMKQQTAQKPPDVSALEKYAERDLRKGKLKQRARALLITEISGLERLFASTPKKSPDRPQLVRRLAEGYVELENAAVRDKIAAEIKVQDLKKTHKNSYSYREEASKAKKIIDQARKRAISYYTKMKDEYPNYSRLDEVLYYLAYEYEQSGDVQSARKVYFELIQKAPKSPYIPNAYLAFGELFFQEAQGDPSKWVLAEQSYLAVAKYPPPDNKVYGYALYKLGYVYWNQGDYAQAINQFKKVIEYGDKFSNLPNAPQLAKSARRDLIPVYAASGAPNKAYVFFKPLSGDTNGDGKTIDMMNELGMAYLDTGHYKDGVVLYQDLLSRDPGKKNCFYQSQITMAIQAIYSGDKDRVVKELDNQLRVRKEFGAKDFPAKEKLECSNKTAELVAETAMSWHLEAVGSGGVRGTGDKKTMDLAAILYKRVADNFTADDFSKFEFPRIVKSDWPTMYKIKYAMADLLYFQQNWEKCGPAFDAVVDENPKGENAAEAAYASVLCYQKMYDQMYKGQADRQGKGLGPKGSSEEDRKAKAGEWEKFKPKPLTDMQKGMVQAFNRYVCYITPPKGNAEAEEQYVEVKYARARTYFEAQHWEEAALGFRDVALNYADKDAGIYAAQLYLEAVNVLGGRADPPRPKCFDDMGDDVLQFLDLYCQGKKAEDNKEQCQLLTRIKFDIQRLSAQKTVELADNQAGKSNFKDALDNYKKGAEAYLTLWRTYCEEPLSKGEHPTQCEKADEIVYNMAKAYQAGRLLAKSIQSRAILLDPKYGLNKSPLAQKAIYEIGGNYQAIAVYDRAAEYFEKYCDATAFKGEFGDQALGDAVVLRLGLGQDDEAIKDAQNYNKYYGRKKPAQTAQIAFAIADHYASKGDWENARKYLAGGMPLIDKNATLDIRAQAHALLGRAYVQLKRDGGNEYGAVVKLWGDPKAAVSQINGIAGEDENAKTRRLGRALEAVGESLFYFAEQTKAKADKVKFPEYKGTFTAKKPSKTASSEAWRKYMDDMKKEKEAIEKHINVKVAGWIKTKKPLIEDATKDYKRIVDLQPVPPPRWVIAAGSQVGSMWGGFVKEFRAAPIPSYMKEDDEIRNTYYASLDGASEPQKQIAKGAFETCLGYSVKYQYFDDYSRACEVWLAQNYKGEYHLIDEFRGAPDRVNSALREQARPLRIGGEPLITGEEKPELKAKADADKDKDKKDK